MRRELRERGMFCAAVPTICLRFLNRPIPTLGNRLYDGGVQAYAGGIYGAGYYSAVMQPFSPTAAKHAAEHTRSPVLLMKKYLGEALEAQGHVALLLPSGYVLQATLTDGLNWWWHIDLEAAYWLRGGYMVHPRDWCD